MSAEETASSMLNRDAAKRAWRKIAETGAATRDAARLLQVGLREYLDLFSHKYLGDNGAGGTFKLVLGANGEKLSKQNGAQALDLSDPLVALNAAAHALDLPASASPATVPDALAHWTGHWAQRWIER